MPGLKRVESKIFTVSPGDVLALRRELAEQLPDIIGRSYAEIRAAYGVDDDADGDGDESGMIICDGLALINITGPITRSDGFCSYLFGGTSIDAVRAQLRQALASSAVQGIMLYVDSPGGSADGVADMADEIYAARNSKPIHAYVDSMGCSAAYWLLTAASEVSICQTSAIGCIGAYSTFVDRSKMYEQAGVKQITVVSSQSPRKALDPTTDEGRQSIQDRLDTVVDIFIAGIARHRGVSPATVQETFGQGDAVIGAAAVARGMADSVGTFDQAQARLRAAFPKQASPGRAQFSLAARERELNLLALEAKNE